MGRTGLDKSDVRVARDSLIAQSQYPSVDAVRIALGNTGSKTTIHKYLKELEDEEGGAPAKATVSDALHDLVERLAARLAEEADVRVERMAQEFAHKEQALSAALQAVEQQVATLAARLAESEQHRKSLEEGQREARGALEQHRRSADEQRKQDQQRHDRLMKQAQAEAREHQLAANARQVEIVKLERECARLTLEAAHVKRSLYEQLTQGRKLEQKIELLQSAHVHAGDIERQLAGKTAQVELLGEQLQAANAKLEPATALARELELALAQANAKLQAQQQIGEQLQGYLDKMAPGRKTKIVK